MRPRHRCIDTRSNMADDENRPIDVFIEEKLKILILERDDTLYVLRNANYNEISEQMKFYEENLNEIRNLQRE